MSDTKNRAKQAIAESVRHQQIVTVQADGLECEDLVEVLGTTPGVSDSVESEKDGRTLWECWGTTDDGQDWRVHVLWPEAPAV